MRLKIFGYVVLASALLLAMPAAAQSISRNDIAAILQTCPQAFASPIGNIDEHRRKVIPYVAMKLNERDGADKWRLLYRMDRQDSDPAPGRLTADVLVWTATREHYDVLSSTGAMSPIKHPPITDRDWQLRRPEDFPTLCSRTPEPPPTPQPPPASDVEQRLRAIEERLERHLKP
jgi:hypothetical protein